MFRKFVLLIAIATFLFSSHAEAKVVELTAYNFNKIVNDPTKDVFVMFYAPWCKYCVQVKPLLKELGDKKMKDVIVARIDGDEYPSVVKPHITQGYPTLKLFPKNNKKGIEFNQDRSVDGFEKFVLANVE